MTQEEIDDVITYLLNDEEYWTQLKFFFDTKMSVENPKSAWLRSIFYAGAPLHVKGIEYKSLADRKLE